MKMKVFSCVMLLVLVVALAVAASPTGLKDSVVTLDATFDFSCTGSVSFNTGSSAHVAGTGQGTMVAVKSNTLHCTMKTNSALTMTIEADDDFVGTGTNTHTMNATWYVCFSSNGADWFRIVYSGSIPSGIKYINVDNLNAWNIIHGSLASYTPPVAIGVGYSRLRVTVDRNGWNDQADTYTATMTWNIAQ